MNGDELASSGISRWEEFSHGIVVASVPAVPGVYAICAAVPFGRLFGSSDILYIGCTSNLRSRIGSYRRDDGVLARRTTNQRLRDYLVEGRLDTVGWVERPDRRHARVLEEMLLERYEREHGELPPLNRSG